MRLRACQSSVDHQCPSKAVASSVGSRMDTTRVTSPPPLSRPDPSSLVCLADLPADAPSPLRRFAPGACSLAKEVPPRPRRRNQHPTQQHTAAGTCMLPALVNDNGHHLFFLPQREFGSIMNSSCFLSSTAPGSVD